MFRQAQRMAHPSHCRFWERLYGFSRSLKSKYLQPAASGQCKLIAFWAQNRRPRLKGSCRTWKAWTTLAGLSVVGERNQEPHRLITVLLLALGYLVDICFFIDSIVVHKDDHSLLQSPSSQRLPSVTADIHSGYPQDGGICTKISQQQRRAFERDHARSHLSSSACV